MDKEKRSPLRIILTGLAGLITLAYPFLVYFGLTRWNARGLALMLLIVFGLRFLLLRGEAANTLRNLAPALIAAGVICLLVLFRNDGQFLLYYPVAMNLAMLSAFAFTLRQPPSMIERFARLAEPELPDDAIGYCRNVTVVWCVFLGLNGLAALGTALHGDMKLWTLYNGLIAYLLMGLLFAVEYGVRCYVRRKNGY